MVLITESSFYQICKSFPPELLFHIQGEVLRGFNILELSGLLKKNEWSSIIKTVLQQSCFYILHCQDIHGVENTFLQIQSVKGKIHIDSAEFQEFVRLMGFYSISAFELRFKSFDWNNNSQTCTLSIPRIITENGYLNELVMASSRISTGFVGALSLNLLFNYNLSWKFVEFTLRTSSFPCLPDLANLRLTKFSHLEKLIIDVSNQCGIDWCIKLLAFSDSTEHCYLDKLTHLKEIVIHLSDRIQSGSPEIESTLLQLSCSIDQYERRYQIPVNVESNKPFYCIKRPMLPNGAEIEPLVIKHLNDNITSISINSNSGFQLSSDGPNCNDHFKWISDCSRLASLTLSPSNGLVIPSESFIAVSNTLKHIEIKKYKFEDPHITNIPWKKLHMLSSLKVTNCTSNSNFVSHFSSLPNLKSLIISNFSTPNNQTSQFVLPQSIRYFNWDGSKFPVISAPYPQFLVEAKFTNLASGSSIEKIHFSPTILSLNSRWNLFNPSTNFNALIDTDHFELNVPGDGVCDLNFLAPNINSLKIDVSGYDGLINCFPETLSVLDVDLGSKNLDILTEASSCWSSHLGFLNITYAGIDPLDFTLVNLEGLHSIIVIDQVGSLKSIKIGEIPSSLGLFKIQRSLNGNYSSLHLSVPRITKKLMDLGIMKYCDEVEELQNGFI